MRSYALKELTERPAHMCNHEHRLSSSFKDEDETNFQPQQQQQQQQVYMAATRPTTTATRNIFKMFKITKKAQVSGTSANSSFGDDDSVDVASSSSSTRQPTFIVKSKSTDKLSSKFLNMILAARHSSTSSVSRHKSTSAEDCKILLPKYHKFKPFQIVIRRSLETTESLASASLGFTVVGYCPCQVGKVEKETNGLVVGDLIIKINGKNVSRATCDSIVKLIKSQTHKLKIEILRAVKNSGNNGVKKKVARSWSNKLGSQDSLKEAEDEWSGELIERKRTAAVNSLTSSSSVVAAAHHIYSTTASSHQQQQHYYYYYNHSNEGGMAANSTETTQLRRRHNHIARPLNYTVVDEEDLIVSVDPVRVGDDDDMIDPLPVPPSTIPSSLPSTTTATTTQVASLQLVAASSVDSSMPSPIPYLPPLTDSDYRTQSSSSSNHSSSQHDDDSHLNACEALLNLEERFIELMQRGVQQYSRPLRHCAMINVQQHEQLFQNIEKLLAISEYQLNQLVSKDESMLLDMFASIGRLYENKMRMSCEAFDLYLSGVRKSFELLAELTRARNSKLARFLADSDADMSLAVFLLLPLHYVTMIEQCLNEIRRRTRTSSQDYVTLSSLIARLESYVNKSRPLLAGQMNPLCGEHEQHVIQWDEDEDDIVDDECSEVEDEVDDEEDDEDNPHRYKNMMIRLAAQQRNTTPIDHQEQQQKQQQNNLIHSSALFYRQSCHKWKKIRVLFFHDRCVMLNAQVSVHQFMDALCSGSQSRLDRLKHKTINFNQISRVLFSQSQQRYRNEFVIMYMRRNASDSLSSPPQAQRLQAALKFKCGSRDDMLSWKKLFDAYVKQQPQQQQRKR